MMLMVIVLLLLMMLMLYDAITVAVTIYSSSTISSPKSIPNIVMVLAVIN